MTPSTWTRREACSTTAKQYSLANVIVSTWEKSAARIPDAWVSTYAAVISGDQNAIATGLETIYTETANVRKASKVAPARTTTGTTSGGAPVGRSDRSAPRPLKPEVLAHLAAFPGKEFTPGEIAKVLDRSSGAVANALDTLVKTGDAVLTSERPHRYTGATTPAAPSGFPRPWKRR